MVGWENCRVLVMMVQFRYSLLALLAVAISASLIDPTPADAQTTLKMVLNWKYQGPQGWFFLADDRGCCLKAEGLELTIGAMARAPPCHSSQTVPTTSVLAT